MLDNQNIQIPASRVPVVDAKAQLMERPWYRFFSDFYYYFTGLPYGTFLCTGSISEAANTPSSISFDTSLNTRHTYIGSPISRIYFDADGLTTITFSIQFTNASASEDDVYVWIRKNGVDLENTASTVTVPKKHGSVDGAALLTVNFHEIYGPGDYLELYWLTVSGDTSITTVPATTSPAKPASPGVVLTISQII